MSDHNQHKILVLLILLVITLWAMTSPILAQTEKPDDVMTAVKEQIEASGQYNFTAQIEQTLIPRPIPVNIGTTEQRIDTQMTGKVILPNYAQINLQFEANGDVPPITIEQDGVNVYLIQNGERTLIENPLSVSPTTDFLGYIDATANVRVKENPDQPQLTIYEFDIDGAKFAAYALSVMRSQLSPEQQMAPIVLPPSLQKMTGHGELWVDADGYPQRQILDITTPEVNEQFDAQSHMVIDFGFETAVSNLPLLTTDNVLAETAPVASIPATTNSATWSPTNFLLQLLLLIIALIFAYYIASSHRWLRPVLPILIVVIMVGTPILQPISYAHAEAQAAKALPSLAQALGVAEANGETSQNETTNISQMQANTSLQQQNLAQTTTCGTGSTSDDADLDGTNDFVENCLGTNPYSVDTDFDGISDTLEIEGFVFTNTASITHTFYSNPREYDTNDDGLDDRAEWLLPTGTANALDPDGDDIPNLWDDDNDGDGLGDEEDMDPFTVSAYQPNFTVRTGLNGSSFNGYQYIQFQVQPQDQSHFQLVTTELDWPYDDRGTIQARDTTRLDEMTFSPMLKVTTNNAPEDFLQEMYGITVVPQGNNTVMYIDLAPVSDGGRITAFQGKVAYAPWELADINWSKVEFVWTVMMKHSSVNEADNSKYITIPIAEYAESNFRFAGLEVTKSGAVDYAVIGTPAAQTNHRQLVNLLAGLEGSYLNTLNPDFDTLVNRLSTPTTALTETWGVPVSNIAVGLPSMQPHHLDEIMARPFDSYTAVSNFLNSNGYSLTQMASVIIAMEAKTGADSLDSGTAINGNTFTFNLAQIPVATMRTVTLSHYKHNGTRWDDMPDLDAINSLIANYPGDPNAVLADLQQVYPDLTAVDLANALFAFYMVWANGRSAIISFDDLTVVAETEPLEPLNQQINLPLITDTLAYLMNAYQLGVVGGSVVFNDPVTYQQYASDYSAVPGGTNVAIGFMIASGAFNLAIDGWRWFSLAYWGGNAGFRSIQLAADGYSSTARWLFGAEKVVAASKPVELATASRIVINWTPPVKKVSFMVKLSKRVGNTMVKYSKLMAKIGRVLGIITFGVSIALIWVNYAKFSSPYTYEKTYAAIYATLDTLFTTLSFIIGLTGFGSVLIVIFLILDLVGLIITTIAGVPQDSIVTTAISKLIADIQPNTTVYSVDFNGVSVNVNGNGYTVAGSTVTLSDKFEGTLSGYLNEDIKYLVASDIYGTMQARAGANIVAAAGNDVNTDRFRCHINGGYKECDNRLWADYTFANAGRDQKLEFFYEIVAKTQYVQYSLGGLIAKDHEDIMYLPSELREADRWGWIPVYIDVLPNTLDGLLNWFELSTNDLDGDDIDNLTEVLLTTLPPNYPTDIDGDGLINGRDADRDGDGLSDTFETISQNSLGTDPNKADTDGDGLSDGLEWQLNSNIKLVDSDNDGLDDGEEVFHWNGSAWTGGGWFMTIDGRSYWVFSDVTAVDRDRDNLNDANEKANGTSPNAVNNAPNLELAASPLITTPFGATGIYVNVGDAVTSTLRLYNTGASVIDNTLTFCVPSALSNVNITVSGDRIPATQQNGNCYNWDFSSNPLLLFQRFNVEMSAIATGSTVTDTLSATVPYNISGTPSPISVNVPFVQDNTPPTVQITEPMSNTILTSQFYVMGGYAADATSWLDHVDVTVPAGTFAATLSDARWGYTWELPDDGLITVTAVAYDALGNASSPASVQVLVDTLAPDITINLADGATISAGQAYSTTIPLSGTVTDNFAGVVRVQLRHNRTPWRTIWEDNNHPLSTNWNGLWELPTTENAQGEHSIYLRAYDAYGNVSAITRTLFIDVLPPTNGLTNRAFVQETPHHVPGGQPVPLYGVASDAGNNPLPADPADLSGNLHSINDATFWLQVDNLSEKDGGSTVTWLGDVNGDRLGDLAVGLPGANGGTGKVVVVNGRPGGWPIPTIGELEFLQENTPSYLGTTAASIGAIVQPAGDVNGDGMDDMMIGDPANGRVILILGSAGNGVHEQELNGQAPRQIEILTQAAVESLSNLSATQLAGVGDVTNDGLSDIMVTVSTTSGSRVYLLAGDMPFLTPQGLDSRAAAIFDTSAANVSVAGVGDVDDDFIPDFAIAANNTIYLFAGGGGWVRGGLTLLTTADAIATFVTTDSLPTIVSAGDVNGDNITDFAFTSGSSPVVVYGNANQNFTTQTLAGFPSPVSGFLAAVGDVDKDGRGDLLIGNADGDAYLLAGSNLNSVAATIAGVATAASTPYIAAADLAGDGSSDLAIVPVADMVFNLGANNLGQPAPLIARTSLPEVKGATSEQSTTANNLMAIPSLLPGDATVGAVGADYTSIQAAIDSGASRVLIQPGIYAETITLANNVQVIGSGADRTILAFPGGVVATTLVEANGVSNAVLMNLTLLGKGSGTGLSVTNSATDVRLERAIVQGMATAVAVNNSATTLSLKNNSIVGNVDGFVATGNAGVDIRNTIFAYNTGTAVQYDPTAVLQLHQYNLYYANGTDLTPNNPGGGELFSDPLFLDFANGDFRTESFSPVVDAGTPNDPVPPGAGTAVDIGHMEQTGSSFFADDNYCDVCTNDGLIWGVDAFATIQEAVDAAQNDIANLQLDTPIQFTVGVNDGVYAESVVISGSVQLLGRAPDQTTIQGVSGAAVTFDTAVNAGVSGFTLIGGGADPIGILVQGGSNSIDIVHNLIKNNSIGISVTQRATGNATFNTIISNTTGVELGRGTYFNTVEVAPGVYERQLADSCFSIILCEERGYLWLDMSNNIVSGNGVGLTAVGKSVLFSDYNLLNNTVDYSNVISGEHDLIGQNPLLTGAYGYLQVGSPALDMAPANIIPPAGGGLRADWGWHELRTAPISVFMGQPDESLATESIGVGQVEYAVVPVADPAVPVTATLPTTWTVATLDNPGAKLTYWQTNYNATADGYYRLYSRATDLLGNTEAEIGDWYDGAFVVDSNAPIVTMTLSVGLVNNWLLMEAQVADYIGTSFDIDEYYFTMDGVRVDGRWAIEEWTADGTSPRTFRYFFQNNSGVDMFNVDIQAVAVDGAGHIGSSAIQTVNIPGSGVNQWLDSISPRAITITNPIPGTYVTGTVTFTGLAWDNGAFFSPVFEEQDSKTAGIELSFDGGVTWQTAVNWQPVAPDPDRFIADRKWEYTWTVPTGLDATTIPVRVRATDNAGNFRSEVITVTLDTAPPRAFTPLFNLPQGLFMDQGELITGDWGPSLDGSGWVTGTSVVENGNGTISLFPKPDYHVEDVGSEGIPVDFRFGVRDEAENVVYDDFGSWKGGDVAGRPPDYAEWAGFQYLERDGFMDITNNEWLTATEFLDDDERAENPQSLWTTWDSYSAYVGWQGASWGPDGSLWLYFDLFTDGSNIGISDGRQLPFEADFAVSAVDADTAYFWHYEVGSSSWISELLPTPDNNPFQPGYGHDPAGKQTEIRALFLDYLGGGTTGTVDWNRMFAYTINPDGAVTSAFPTVNNLNGPFGYYYQWNSASDPYNLLELPTSVPQPAVSLSVTSNPPVQDTVTVNQTITYVASISTLEDEDEAGIQMMVNGSSAVAYQTIEGAASYDCSAILSCVVDLPTIPAGGTQVVTITAVATADLAMLGTAFSSIQLTSDVFELPNAYVALTHEADITAPTVTIGTHPGNAIGTGLQTVFGTADDDIGAGVATVEVSTDGVNWQLANGTQFWSADIIAPAGPTWTLYVRATDFHNQTSVIETVTLVEDTTMPILTPTVPSLVGGASVVVLSGAAQDPAPTDAAVGAVAAQLDNENAAWRSAILAAPQANGEQNWLFVWELPAEDGVMHNIRFRATDFASNDTVTGWYTTTIDTIAPTVTVTQQITQVVLGGSMPAWAGMVSDGTGVTTATIELYAQSGAPIADVMTLNGNQWSYVMNQPVGQYTAWLRFVDAADNRRVVGPFAITVVSNSAPMAVDDDGVTDEDTAVTLDILANDSDPNGDPLTIDSVTQPANGVVSNNGNNVTYTPTLNFNGTDVFTYTINDGTGGQDTALVTLTVNPVNDAPVANDDSGVTDEDTAVLINVLSNDSDVDGDSLIVDSVTQGSNGTVTNNGSDVTYTPDANFNGSDVFTYNVSDGNDGLDTAVVSVTIQAVNDAPVANDDAAMTDENTAVTIPVLTNDTDIDGDSLTVDSVTQGSNGSVINNGNDLTYTPNSGFSGSDVFTYTVSDSNGGSDTATVTVMVALGNTAPVADAGGPYTVNEGQSVMLDASGTTDGEQDPATLLYAWDFDGDGQYDDATGIMPAFSALTLDGPLTVTVGLQVMDGGGLMGTDTAVITILNIPPTITNLTYLPVIFGEHATITVAAYDPFDAMSYAFDCDNDGNFEIGAQPSNSANCAFASPGNFTVNVQVSDDDGGLANGLLMVTVTSQQEAIVNLQAAVQSLSDQGILNSGQVRGLNRTLDSAIKKLNQGNSKAAINKFVEFTAKINGFVADGALTPEQAQPLLDAANRIIAAIQATG